MTAVANLFQSPLQHVDVHIAGDVTGRVAVGNHILQIGSMYAAVIRSFSISNDGWDNGREVMNEE